MPCGYVFGHYYPVGFVITEIGAVPTELDTIPALVNAVGEEATRRGNPPRGRVYMPSEPAVDQGLAQFFGASLHGGAEPDSMLRPIAGGITADQVDKILTAPGAIRWPIDQV
jgi:hypothetical protein